MFTHVAGCWKSISLAVAREISHQLAHDVLIRHPFDDDTRISDDCGLLVLISGSPTNLDYRCLPCTTIPSAQAPGSIEPRLSNIVQAYSMAGHLRSTEDKLKSNPLHPENFQKLLLIGICSCRASMTSDLALYAHSIAYSWCLSEELDLDQANAFVSAVRCVRLGMKSLLTRMFK